MTTAQALESALEKAKAALKKPKEDEASKQKKGKIRGIAERMLSIGNKLDEAGKPPDASVIKQLRGLMNELGAAIDRYPSPKRSVKSEQMDAAAFLEHIVAEIKKGVDENDAERLEQAEINIASVTNQADGDDEIGKVRIDVIEGSEKSEGQVPNAAFADLAESLNSLVESLKAKKPKDAEDGADKAKKPKEGEDAEKAKKPKPEEMSEKDKKKNPEEDEAEKAKKKPKDDEVDMKKQVRCPSCGALNQEGAASCASCGAKLAKSDAQKGDVIWPSDMNAGRKLADGEEWGRVKKSVDGEDRCFGPDPQPE